MTGRTLARVALSTAVLVAAAAPTFAQPAAQASGAVRGRQAINVFFGGFVPRGEDGPAFTLIGGRALGDVLISTQVSFVHVEIADFKSATSGGEWLVPIGNRIEIGSGVGVSRQTVHTPYDGYIDTDGSDIVADLSLRIVPIPFTARVLPLGQASRFQPYVGAGVALFRWKYQQSGEYADVFNALAPPPGPCTFECPFEIFKPPPAERFTASGTTVGPVLLGGIRFASGAFSVGGEIRYQRAVGDLPRDTNLFGTTVNLGGLTYQLTTGLRFH